MKVELLAPAGSYEALEAAFEAGADAVYLGGQKFGARAYADNLDQEQLIRAIDLAHLKGKQLYLTINTLLKNRELETELYEYLAPLYEAGLDAVIVQDPGVMDFVIFSGAAHSCQYADDDHRCGERKAFTESRGNPCGDCEGTVTGRN